MFINGCYLLKPQIQSDSLLIIVILYSLMLLSSVKGRTKKTNPLQIGPLHKLIDLTIDIIGFRGLIITVLFFKKVTS